MMEILEEKRFPIALFHQLNLRATPPEVPPNKSLRYPKEEI